MDSPNLSFDDRTDAVVRRIAVLEDRLARLEQATSEPNRRELILLLDANDRVRRLLDGLEHLDGDEIQYRLDCRIGALFDRSRTEPAHPTPTGVTTEPDFLTEAASLISYTNTDRAKGGKDWQWLVYLPAMLLIIVGFALSDRYEFQGKSVDLGDYCLAFETHEVLNRTVEVIVADDSGPCDEVAELAADRTPWRVALIATGLLSIVVTAWIARKRWRAAIRRIPDSVFGGRT